MGADELTEQRIYIKGTGVDGLGFYNALKKFKHLRLLNAILCTMIYVLAQYRVILRGCRRVQ